MTVDEMKLLDCSKLNGVALKPNPSSASLISRSLSSCSTDDFLPTFESEDDDWRKFGWLLELNDIKLPCLNDDEKVLKLYDVKQEHQPIVDCQQTKLSCGIAEIKMEEQCEECVDPSEFYVNRHETGSQCSESIQSTVDCVGQGTPHVAQLPSPALFGNDELLPEGAHYEEKPHCLAYIEETEQAAKRNEERDDDAEEPVAKRTRKALARKGSIECEFFNESKVQFIIGDEDEKIGEDNTDSKTPRHRSDSLCNSVFDYGPPTMSSGTVTPIFGERPSQHEVSDSETDEEPVAKRTRHALPSISLDDGVLISVINWQPVVQADGLSTPTKAKRNATRRKYTKRLYCLCQTPYDRKQFYVGCDACNGWFHPACIGISEAEAIGAEYYYCPKCVQVKREVDDV